MLTTLVTLPSVISTLTAVLAEVHRQRLVLAVEACDPHRPAVLGGRVVGLGLGEPDQHGGRGVDGGQGRVGRRAPAVVPSGDVVSGAAVDSGGDVVSGTVDPGTVVSGVVVAGAVVAGLSSPQAATPAARAATTTTDAARRWGFISLRRFHIAPRFPGIGTILGRTVSLKSDLVAARSRCRGLATGPWVRNSSSRRLLVTVERALKDQLAEPSRHGPVVADRRRRADRPDRAHSAPTSDVVPWPLASRYREPGSAPDRP